MVYYQIGLVSARLLMAAGIPTIPDRRCRSEPDSREESEVRSISTERQGGAFQHLFTMVLKL